MGLRNTLEPDPDNTGVGSFLEPSSSSSFHRSPSSFVSRKFEAKEVHVICRCHSPAIIKSFSASPTSFAGAFLLSLCLALPLTAQTAQQNPAPAPQNSQTPAQQKPAPVTTTVIVHGEIEDNYLPESVTVGTLDGAPLREHRFRPPSSPATCSTTRSRACFLTWSRTMPRSATTTCPWATTATTRFAAFLSISPRDSKSTA